MGSKLSCRVVGELFDFPIEGQAHVVCCVTSALREAVFGLSRVLWAELIALRFVMARAV